MATPPNHMVIVKWAAGIIGSILSSLIIFSVVNISTQVSTAVGKISEMTTQIAVLNANLSTVNDKLTSLAADKYTSSQAASDRTITNSQIANINSNYSDLKRDLIGHIATPNHAGTHTELAIIKERIKNVEDMLNARPNPK